jgi:bacillolysin
MRRLTALGTLAFLGWMFVAGHQTVSGQARALTVAPSTAEAVRDWDNVVNRMIRTRELNLRVRQEDTLIPGRTIERLDQYFQGVRIWGANLTRQLDGLQTVSVFGIVYAELTVDTNPLTSESEAKAVIEGIAGAPLPPDRRLELVILPTDGGMFSLAWVGDVATGNDSLRLFIDARTGTELRRDSTIEKQAPMSFVGHGKGVLGDDKKVSANSAAGGFILFDTLRPPDISTFDLRSNLIRTKQFLMGRLAFGTSDYGFSSNNDWSDQALVDAHVHSSFTYDYYFKRFGRRGLDGADKHIWNLTHAVRRDDIFTATPSDVGSFWLNAFYAGDGVMFYGEGLPVGFFIRANGHYYNYFSGALDIVAHELTHGVTQYTSNLEYRSESGALNEAFSDVMGTSAEFFFQPAGTGPMKADYFIGEDISVPVVPGALPAGDRSMENPGLFGQPDHYSHLVVLPPDPDHDNGGVHINSGIPNQAFYLAIEGGTNRTSGIRVQGVGASNREQIEKIFYRAFAQLMPSNANFSMARAITLRAAQDLYGLNSAPFNAVRDAWTAVGVN